MIEADLTADCPLEVWRPVDVAAIAVIVAADPLSVAAAWDVEADKYYKPTPPDRKAKVKKAARRKKA